MSPFIKNYKERVYEMSMTFGTPFDTSVKTLQNRVYEMSGCTSCLQTICPGIPIVWGRYVRVYELSLDQMSKQTKCQGVRNVMGVRNVLLPFFGIGGNFVSLPSTRITISMTCHRHDFLKGINPKALAVQATLVHVLCSVACEGRRRRRKFYT